MATQPTFAWSASGGSITAAGMFTAPSVVGSDTITAKIGSVAGTAVVQVTSGALQDSALASLVSSLDADGSISRLDMIKILQTVDAKGAHAVDFSDLKKIVNEAAVLDMPSYVQVLASDVINGNVANATFQGAPMGNLAVGSSAAQLTNLINKWFYGADLPALCDKTLVYKSTAGSLFPHTPSHTDEYQGEMGDCYLITALGTLADSNPAAIENMIINNGDGTYTVRFYTGPYGTIYNYSDGSISAGFSNNAGVADYVTVNSMLPVNSQGKLALADAGASYTNAANALWIPLIEKAYAQWDQTGNEGRTGVNAYQDIQGGWMATVDAQVLGHNGTDYFLTGTTATSEQTAIKALAAKEAVTIGTSSFSGTPCGLYANHAYAIIGYTASTDTFTLYNPWGFDQPSQVKWSQLQQYCTQLCVCNTSGSIAISGAGQRHFDQDILVGGRMECGCRRAAFRGCRLDVCTIRRRPRGGFLRRKPREVRGVPGSGEQQRSEFASAPSRRPGVHRALAVSNRCGFAIASRVGLIGLSPATASQANGRPAG